MNHKEKRELLKEHAGLTAEQADSVIYLSDFHYMQVEHIAMNSRDSDQLADDYGQTVALGLLTGVQGDDEEIMPVVLVNGLVALGEPRLVVQEKASTLFYPGRG